MSEVAVSPRCAPCISPFERFEARLRCRLKPRRNSHVAEKSEGKSAPERDVKKPGVRKSLALNSSPSCSLRYSLMSSERSCASATLAVGEQLGGAASAPLERGDQIDRHRILDHLQTSGPSLAGIVELDRAAVNVDVLLADRGQANSAVLLGVLLTADTEHSDVEQANGRSQNPVAGRLDRRPPGPGQAVGGGAATAPQRSACARTSRGRGARASAGGRDTAGGRPRRPRWPGDGQAGPGTATRLPTPVGRRAHGFAPTPRGP